MIVITGISSLVTNDASLERGKLGIINNAALVVGDNNKIAWTGEAINLPSEFGGTAINVGGRAVIPGFVDSHTHLVLVEIAPPSLKHECRAKLIRLAEFEQRWQQLGRRPMSR
ncbi:imidazolonepropionase [Acidimicrobiaceae bacterium]|nr:imidazolonepropionase [Acidimicrobiaceae bacterium]